MAVFCDLEDDDCSSRNRSRFDAGPSYSQDQLKLDSERASSPLRQPSSVETVPVQLLTINKLAAALTCYPIALSLASHLDLNDLFALAAACRSVHTSLTQYAHQLKSQSVRCTHDGRPMLAETLSVRKETLNERLAAEMHSVAISDTQGLSTAFAESQTHIQPGGLYASMGVSSKIGFCARDLVAPCRKCGTVICRNCAVKPPSNVRLRERLRRLCKTCLDAPLEAHFQNIHSLEDSNDGPPASSASSTQSERSFSGSSASESTTQGGKPEFETHAFTSSAFLRGPCTCESRGVYLCAPCGTNLRAGDTTYQRVFTWRSRYSTHIGGGLGTGLGLGNQGQKCGRGGSCLDTSSEAVCWVEIDCSEGTAQDSGDSDGYSLSRVGTPDSSNNKPGYLQQEVEGIGGVLKKKVKRRIKTGACTYEYADERESGQYLERERKGAVRSWCGWCARVVPSLKDTQETWIELLAV